MGQSKSRVAEETSRKLSHYEKAIVDAILLNDFILLEKLLLESGVNVNSLADANAETLLCISCRLQYHRCTTKLLKFGADPNKESSSSSNLPYPILSASKYGDLKSVSALIEHKAVAGVKDQITGRTALHFACEFGHDGIVDVLLTTARRGINVNDLDASGLSPLHVGSHVGPNQRQTVRRAKCVYRLARMPGVDLDQQNREGEAALHVAARTGNELATAILLRKGADPTVDHHYRRDEVRSYPTRSNSFSRHKMGRNYNSKPRVRVIAFSGTPDMTAKMAGHITLSNLIGESRALRVMRQDAIVPPLEMLCRVAIQNFMTMQFKPISLLKSIVFKGMKKELVDFVSYRTLVICPNTTVKVHEALGSEISHFLHDQTRVPASDASDDQNGVEVGSPRMDDDTMPSNLKISRQLSTSTRAVVEALLSSEKRPASGQYENSDSKSFDLPPIQRFGSEPALLTLETGDTRL